MTQYFTDFFIFQLTITLLQLFFLFQILNQDLLQFTFITSSILKSQKTLKFVSFMWYIFIESCGKRFIWSWEVWCNSYFWKGNVWKPWKKSCLTSWPSLGDRSGHPLLVFLDATMTPLKSDGHISGKIMQRNSVLTLHKIVQTIHKSL